jgi:thioredoxin reductase
VTVERTELVVIGAGPAGLGAAIEAARAGLEVVVVDENPRMGGQIFRQLPQEFELNDRALLGKEQRRGQAFFSELAGLPIRFLHNATAWGVFGERILEIVHQGRTFPLSGEAVILATGAFDRPVPLPGWSLPGVLTVGGAQNLLKAQRILPGRRILMAGTGPLLLVVASQLVTAGAELAAVAEAVPAWRLLPHIGALVRAWSITRDGLGYRWNVLRARVPWITPFILVRIEGHQNVERAVVARADAQWRPVPSTERAFEVDTVCIGYGLLPSVELARIFGCALRYDSRADAWLPLRSEDFETTVPGVFSVGDGAGIGGAVVAAEEGRIAGLTVAGRLRELERSTLEGRVAAARRRLERLARFRAAMDDVYHVRPGVHELLTEETILCRCEEVRVGAIEEAIAEGVTALDPLKAWTRAGMGPCQARMCGTPTAHLLARRTGASVEALGCYRVRPPVKPVPIDALVAHAR